MSKELFDAIRAGERGNVETMIAADPGLLLAKDENGLGAFAIAKYCGRHELAKMLLDHGVELDLFSACMAGADQRVFDLIRQQPDLIKTNSADGWTALHLACFFGQPAIAEWLMNQGADVNARSTNAMKNAPLHAAAAGRNRDAVRTLLEHGADVNAGQEGGWTALHQAAQNGDVEMARLLIAAGADVNARASNQQNALDLAMTKGGQAMVDLLDEYVTKGS